MSIESLNLSFSNHCPAHCVFCPLERGAFDPNFMSRMVVRRLVEEVASDDFPWKVKTIQVGENGDFFTSPHPIDNLRIIRHVLPRVRINLTTNLFCMKEQQAEIILKDDLLDSLQLNIDGHNAETYEAQKGISYEKVMNNFKIFMKLRKSLNLDFSVGVNVLPLATYCSRVNTRFGQRPLQAPDYIPISTYPQVKKSLQELDWITDDVFIRESPSFFWAERKMNIKFDLSKYSCPQIPRIETEAFISPSGWWYPCCFDSNQDQAYGNINEKSLVEIHNSEKRLNFIDMLKQKQFEEIGYPCNRVPFCKAMK